MKKLLALMLALLMVVSLAACGGNNSDEQPSSENNSGDAEPSSENNSGDANTDNKDLSAEISLWTYPIGDWGKQETVDSIIADFNKVYPNIKVTVSYLDYTNGDDQVNTAIEGNRAPDVIMEGPERLVANWGAKGLMVDLSDLWTSNDDTDINAAVKAACFNSEGKLYEYPLCMTAHCMAINYDIFKEANALQYINEDTHTWKSTDDFFKAVQAVYDSGHENVAAVFCGGQGGDQGTRALINNLYGGTFTNAEHTAYTADSEENVKAIQALYDQAGINFDSSIVGSDEITLFCNGTLAMAFCWNIAQETSDAGKSANFEIFPMAFPTNQSAPALQGGIWGYGVFDNGDSNKITAAKTFINWVCNENTEASVKASSYWSVRTSMSSLYEGDDLKTEYGIFMPYLGDYYQVTAGWAEARTAWWNMLQKVGAGTDVATAVAEFVADANAAAAA